MNPRPENPLATGWGLVRLRRDGTHPLRFSGRLIARHDGAARRATLWHDLALYRTEQACFVVEIVAQLLVAAPRCERRIRPARCHAALFDTLDGALTRMESHDPSHDVCPGIAVPAFRLDDPAVPAAMLMMHAAALQGLCRDVERRYRIGVGVLLADIGLREV